MESCRPQAKCRECMCGKCEFRKTCKFKDRVEGCVIVNKCSDFKKKESI